MRPRDEASPSGERPNGDGCRSTPLRSPLRGLALAREYALLLLLACFWGGSYVFAKIALETIPPASLICGRSLLAALLLMAVLALRGMAMPRDGAAWRTFAVQATINSVVPFLLITWAQQFVDAGLTVVLSSTTPIYAFLLTWAVTRHEPAGLGRLLGTVIGLGGVAVIVGAEALRGLGQELVAQLVIMLATVCFAIGTIRGRHLARFDPMVAAAGSLAVGGLALVPLVVLFEQPWALEHTAKTLGAMATMAVFSSAAGLMLFYRLLATLGPVAVTSQAYLRVPIGVALAVLLLGERVPPGLAAGLVLVVVGVALMTMPIGRRRAA
jgi:drug/metabolite transporter (DMT)-like permease